MVKASVSELRQTMLPWAVPGQAQGDALALPITVINPTGKH